MWARIIRSHDDLDGVSVVDYKELKKRHPRAMKVIQGVKMLVIATVFSYILVAPLYIFGIRAQTLVDIFTFPPDIIPQPYSLIGILLIPIGMLLVIWANYVLLHIGKIGLRDREPMQSPSKLVLFGPYRFTRNPIYLGCLLICYKTLSHIITVGGYGARLSQDSKFIMSHFQIS